MNYTDKNIIETYKGLFEGLSSSHKIGLIENLSKSLKNKNNTKDAKFYKSFGALASSKSATEIIGDIKSSKKFRNRDTEGRS